MSAASLAGGHCVPCRGGIPPMDRRQAEEYLEQLPDWELVDDARWLQRRIPFADFRSALEFVHRAGEVAETEGHHPILTFGWGFCTIRIQTMKIQGLHLNDFILAARLDDLVRAGSARC